MTLLSFSDVLKNMLASSSGSLTYEKMRALKGRDLAFKVKGSKWRKVAEISSVLQKIEDNKTTKLFFRLNDGTVLVFNLEKDPDNFKLILNKKCYGISEIYIFE